MKNSSSQVGKPTEIKIGSVMLFYEQEPPIPSTQQQAGVVGKFLLSISTYASYGNEDNREKFSRLQNGELEAVFRQNTLEEIEEIKSQMVHYDEENLKITLLPVEGQLKSFYIAARAQLWGTEFGKALTWHDWDRIRKTIKIPQLPSIKDEINSLLPEAGTLQARAAARDLASLAVSGDGRLQYEVANASQELLKETFLSARVAYPIHTNLPIQLPERIPSWVWNEGLKTLIEGWWEIEPAEVIDLPSSLNLIAVPSAKPMMMADRAFRTPNVWSYADDLPFYAEKKNPGITLQYIKENRTPEDIREMLTTLDPRTSDVWHLLLAKALENGRSQLYKTFEIDVRDLARALGYKPHHKGGMKPRDIEEVGKALEHISNTWIKITPAETTTLERDQGQTSRKKQQITESTEQRLLTIWERRISRDLFGTTRHLVWEVALGKWASLFPASYAPIFKCLVDLPARGKALWAKQIGKELAFWYREDGPAAIGKPEQRRAIKVIRVRTLLERACLLHEVKQMQQQGNRKRPREYFEAAMDQLKELNVHEGWNYNSTQAARLDAQANKPGSFDLWLETNVELTAPQELLEALPPLPAARKKTSKNKKTVA